MHQRLIKLKQNRLLVVFAIPLFFYIVIFVGLFYWVMEKAQKNETVKSTTTMPLPVMTKDFKAIANWHLFGLSKKSPINEIEDKSLELKGIIYRNGKSLVIVVVNGKEEVFKKGDRINNRYSIHLIEKNRLILSTREGLKYIELFKDQQQGH